MIIQENSLKIINNIYKNYQNYNVHNNLDFEKKIKAKLLSNFKFNDLELVGDIPYYTLYNLEKTKERILEIDEDALIGIIGEPGLGKSTLSFIFSFYLDKNFSEKRIIFSMEELLLFLKECSFEIQKEREDNNYKSYLRGQVIILDEGVFMLFSADSNSKQGKLATKLFTIIRFLNIFMFINITNYEKLNKTIRDSRLYSTIRILKKGLIEFRSKKQTRLIEIDSDNNIKWSKSNFEEKVGFISKNSIFWKNYNNQKSFFVSNAIEQILEELKNVN